jgi:hypothetical protein
MDNLTISEAYAALYEQIKSNPHFFVIAFPTGSRKGTVCACFHRSMVEISKLRGIGVLVGGDTVAKVITDDEANRMGEFVLRLCEELHFKPSKAYRHREQNSDCEVIDYYLIPDWAGYWKDARVDVTNYI